MDFPFVHLYLVCTLFTTLAFLYLIFRFFFVSSKKIFLHQLPVEDVESLNDNIFGLISEICFTETQSNPQKNDQSTMVSTTAKKIINSRKQRSFFKGQYHRQCCNEFPKVGFLPGSELGLSEMKQLNKKYIKENEKGGFLGLVKQKKKKNLSSCVKKYGFHKTNLVTIYEYFEY